MMGYVVGSYLQVLVIFGPVALVLFSKRISGWKKTQWVFYSLLPWLIGQLTLVLWIVTASHEKQTELMIFGSSRIYIATWISTWVICLIFLFRFKKIIKRVSIPSNSDRIRDPGNEEVKSKSRKIKYGIGLFLLALIISPLIWLSYEQRQVDAEMEILCKKDGGIKVYETVTLSKEQFKYGLPEFLKPSSWGEFYNGQRISNSGGGYMVIYKSDELKSQKPTLARTAYSVIREVDGKILGTYVYYQRIGGGITPGLGPDSFKDCPENMTYNTFLKSVFIKAAQGK